MKRLLHCCALAAGAVPAEGPLFAGELRRGADDSERRMISRERWADVALASVTGWGSWRIVVAEDAFNCHGAWCPWVLVDRNGIIHLAGVARERPRIKGDALSWIRPDGTLMTARPY